MRIKSAEKRLAIVRAAFAVVCERGFIDTKVEEIARRAGVAKGTVYLYFRDKPAIYVGLVDWLLEQALAVVSRIRAERISSRAKLERMFGEWAQGVFSRPAVVGLLSLENVEQSNRLMQRFRRQVLPHIRKMTDEIAAVVAEGIKEGEFRPVEPRLAAIMFMNAFRAGIFAARFGQSDPSIVQSAQELFFCGLRANGPTRRAGCRIRSARM